jgi:hypothetical protein
MVYLCERRESALAAIIARNKEVMKVIRIIETVVLGAALAAMLLLLNLGEGKRGWEQAP